MPATHTYRPSSKIPAKMIHVDARNPRRCMNPLTGILPPRGNALGYRSASPNGDGGRGNQHFGVLHVSAATPPQCDGATTTLLSPHYTLHSSHTFSAKEKDSETGLSYFGARYYSSDLSIWLSVDPQASKYPSLSPYVYCADNPVKLVDPNGEDWFEKEGKMYYTTQYTSEKAFKESGIEGDYKGKFFTKNGKYYSLFGQILDAKSKKGKLTQKIDEAFQNYADYIKASRNNNEIQSFDVEPHSWDYPSQKQTDFSGVYSFKEDGITDNYHNSNELGKYANVADIYLFVTAKRMTGELDSFSGGLKRSSVTGNNGFGTIEGYLLKFKNYSGIKENSIVILRFPSAESVKSFQSKFNKLFNIN